MTAPIKAKIVKYLHFHSLSIKKLDQENEASLEFRHVFKGLPRGKFVLVNGMCGISPASLIALKKRFFLKKSLILERNKSQDWDGNHDNKAKA